MPLLLIIPSKDSYFANHFFQTGNLEARRDAEKATGEGFKPLACRV